MKPLRVGVIGCGSIAVMHLDSIKASMQAQLISVCDIKADRAERAAKEYNATAYTDYHTMLCEENLDVVHLCLPHYLHMPVAMDALRAGVHVLTEKPMSIHYKDAVAAVELADELGLQLGVIFQCRYNTPSQLVKQRILDGRLGTVRCGRTVLTWYRPDDYYSTSDWKGTWDKEGGGVIIDQAIHSIDLANWMIDSTPIEVQSTLHNRNHPTMIVEDTGEGLITYENGALLSFYAMNNYLVDDPIEIRLQCERGRAIFSYDRADIVYDDGSTESADNTPLVEISYSGGKEYWGFQHAAQIEQFYRAVRGEEPLEISGREALKIQKIICDIYANNDNISTK